MGGLCDLNYVAKCIKKRRKELLGCGTAKYFSECCLLLQWKISDSGEASIGILV